jgi:hypothetical protein
MRWIEVMCKEKEGESVNEEFEMMKAHFILHESRKCLNYVIYQLNILKQGKFSVSWWNG